MKPRARLKWDRFICWLFDHKWKEVEEGDEKFEFRKAWFICLRCAEAEARPSQPPDWPRPSKKDLEFIEFQKTIRKQIEGGKNGKNKRD